MIDVCVIGGGPAGAITALELTRLGYSTKLMCLSSKRGDWPEAVSPRLPPMLDQLGLASVVNCSAYTDIVEKRVQWGSGDQPKRLFYPGGTIVSRELLDRALITAASTAGVDLVHAAAGLPAQQPDGTWQIPIERESQRIRARFVVFASGRRKVPFGGTYAAGARRIALHGFTRTCKMMPGTMVVANAATCWHWGVSLPGGTYHALAFVRARSLAEPPITTLQRSLPQETKWELLTFHGAADATARAAQEPVGQGWIRVGDAFFAADPLSSSGLYIAALTAVQAARVINTMLRRPRDAIAAIEFYKNVQQQMISHFTTTTAGFYDADQNGAPGVTSSSPRELLPALGDLVISPSIQVRLVPTLTNDLVSMGVGVCHPNQPPSAFFEGIPVVRLLAPLQAGKSVAEALNDWTDLPGQDRARFVQFLVENGLVIEKSTEIIREAGRIRGFHD